MACPEDQEASREAQLVSRRLFLTGNAGGFAGVAIRPAGADKIRQLTFLRPATGEVAWNVPCWRVGAPYEQGLIKLNWLLRDLQVDEVHPIDLRVYYTYANVAQFGSRPILVTSGYRTAATNERLTRQGIDAARNSFHVRGRAADIRIPGVAPVRTGELGVLLGLGGVGLYAKFVHLDTGPKRTWNVSMRTFLVSLCLVFAACGYETRPRHSSGREGQMTALHAGDAVVSVLGSPFYLAVKGVTCAASAAVAMPVAALAALSESYFAPEVRRDLDDGIKKNCGPPYRLGPSRAVQVESAVDASQTTAPVTAPEASPGVSVIPPLAQVLDLPLETPRTEEAPEPAGKPISSSASRG